jgi:hypothetical protein
MYDEPERFFSGSNFFSLASSIKHQAKQGWRTAKIATGSQLAHQKSETITFKESIKHRTKSVAILQISQTQKETSDENIFRALPVE